jgi:hypothetical protein
MRTLYSEMERWQQTNHRRLLSISIQQDSGSYCCIALTNPTEVVITSEDGRTHVTVHPATETRLGRYPARLAVSDQNVH